MQVIVMTLTGKMGALDVVPSDTIGNLKLKILVKAGIPTNQQRLVFAGKELVDDGHTLLSYTIVDQSVIHLIVGLHA